MIKFLELQKTLKDEAFSAFCIFGNDAWLRKKALARICEAYNIVDDGFSVDYLDNPSVNDLSVACFTPSMFGGKKLVVCQNIAVPQPQMAKYKSGIANVLSQNDGSFCLVIMSDNAFDVKGVEGIDCNKLDLKSVVSWIVAYAKRQQVEIDRLCADKIANYCLCDMSRVEMEVQKLIDLGDVTIENVELMVHKDVEYVVFDLTRCIADRNPSKALDMYNVLTSAGEEPRALFGLMYNFYRRAYYAKVSSNSTDELATLLGVKTWAVSKAKETASLYKPMQLKRALELFATADKQLNSFANEDEVLTNLILQLISL